ncbi:MAG TPA: serine hydrolase domain-containing protein [Candidatus Acidoferrum sp.]|nr:serine hydrolase domain-containing protein [Candidatus Acidoferrum sp.]
MKTSIRSRFFWLGSAAVLCCAAIFAQAPKATDTTAPAAPLKLSVAEDSSAKAHELTAEDLGSFLDGLMPQQIEHADIAGAVIAVVKDGKLLFARGYGYADVEKKIPVSPESTLFRPGSISKLFTWTSVMQQVELGKLDLDRDVNDYLDFKIPSAFGKPITLRNIMTHTTGFEETAKDLFVGSAEDLRPTGEYLRVHMPTRIFPPGMTPAYSNYATTMAAYIVERVSGQNFSDYVEEHIFKPLNMTHATFRQPLPEALKPSMSNGYILGSGEAKPFEFVQVAPAGSLSASAVDMTHFMIAHLQNGRYGDAQILKPETAIQMHARQAGWPPSMNAMCLGFYEQWLDGHRSIGHGGDTVSFHSNLHLILDANVGLFVSYNSPGRVEIDPRGYLFESFMGRYFPSAPSNEPTLATAARDASSVAGTYEVSRRFETNVLAVTTVLGETKVTVNPKDNTISMGDMKGLNQQPLRFREIAPMVFRDVNGPAKVAFVNDATGRRVAYIDYPFMVFQQVNNTLDKQRVNYFIIGFSLTVIVLTLLMWPIAAMLRKHYGKPLTLNPGAKRLRLLVRLVCLGVVAFVVGLLIFVSKTSNPSELSERGDFGLHVLQVVGLLTGLGALIAIYNSLKSWGDSQQWFWNKIWNTFLAFACVGFFWFIYHWHLLNFHLSY